MPLKQTILTALHKVGALRLARRLNKGKFLGATVLLYHRVLPAAAPDDHYVALMGDPTVPQLEALIVELKRTFRFTTPAECLHRWRKQQEVDPYSLILTFDDGYLDLHELLLPALRKCQVPATVFVTTGAVGGYVTWFQKLFAAMAQTTCIVTPSFADLQPLPLHSAPQRVAAIGAISKRQRNYPATDWEEMIDRLCDGLGWNGDLTDERMMNWSQVEALHRSGWVTIGGHTVSHPMLERCTPEKARREIFDSAAALRERLRPEILPFAYPHGGLPPAWAQELLREAGYDCAFTGRRAVNTRLTPVYQLGRQHVAPNNLPRASLELSGLRRRRDSGGGGGRSPATGPAQTTRHSGDDRPFVQPAANRVQ